jgi:hypothetical protein
MTIAFTGERSSRRHGGVRLRWIAAAAAVVGVLLGAPSAASAVTRFAAPGGNAPDTDCTTREDPCSIGAAAGGPDVTATDEAVILPGEYSDADLMGDSSLPTDHVVQPIAASVHGEFGSPRPVITLDTNSGFGAFLIGLQTTTVSHLEIDTAVSQSNLSVGAGTAEDLIVHSSAPNSIACDNAVTTGSLIRNTVCLSSGANATALGTSLGTFPGTRTVRLRNVTAVATGSSSRGISYQVTGAMVNYNVDAKSVIARGAANDVVAAGTSFTGTPNTGANTAITLDHSNYALTLTTTDAGGGTATVTPAGSGTNQTAAPRLAADGYHEVVGSPTIEAGAVDAFSGTTDIDGQNRSIVELPDIGADEIGFPTSTSVSCSPNPLPLGSGSSRCSVTVTDLSGLLDTTFGSGVRISSDGPGDIASACELLGTTPTGQVTCFFDYTPAATGTHRLTATFPGDRTHDSSEASDVLDVIPPPGAAAGPGTTPPGSTPPAARKKCKKRKGHAASAGKKCKRRKKR